MQYRFKSKISTLNNSLVLLLNDPLDLNCVQLLLQAYDFAAEKNQNRGAQCTGREMVYHTKGKVKMQ